MVELGEKIEEVTNSLSSEKGSEFVRFVMSHICEADYEDPGFSTGQSDWRINDDSQVTFLNRVNFSIKRKGTDMAPSLDYSVRLGSALIDDPLLSISYNNLRLPQPRFSQDGMQWERPQPFMVEPGVGLIRPVAAKVASSLVERLSELEQADKMYLVDVADLHNQTAINVA